MSIGWAIFWIWMSCNVGFVLGLFWAGARR